MKRICLLLIGMLIIGQQVFSNGQQEETTKEKVTLSWYDVRAYGGPHEKETLNECYTYQLATEKTGVNIEWTHRGDLNILLASGVIPDIITTEIERYPGGRTKAFLDGLIIDLAPHLDKMSNLKALMESDQRIRKPFYDNEGRILALLPIFDQQKRPWAGWHIRQDWLDRVGMEMPETIDEFYNVLKAFKTANLNGTGGPVLGGESTGWMGMSIPWLSL